MAKAETMVPTIDKDTLAIQNLKQANGELCDYDPFRMTMSKKEKEEWTKMAKAHNDKLDAEIKEKAEAEAASAAKKEADEEKVEL
jgi:hypothetical protein